MMDEVDKRVKPENYEVGRLFSSEFVFKIPLFQRPFSWKADNFDNLFEDIYASFENGEEEYFLGPLLFQRESSKIYSIIDGQQRLMSLAILLAVIRDHTKSQSLKESINSSLYESGDKFKSIPSAPRIDIWEDLKIKGVDKYIFTPSDSKDTLKFVEDIKNGVIKYIGKKDPIYSIYTAIELFTDKYYTYLEDGNDEIFVEYLYQKVYFVGIVTHNLPYAIKLFNVLNNRGMRLSAGDILKAVNLAVIGEKYREQYAKIWRDIENNIGRENSEKVIEFMRTLLLKTKAKKGIIDEFEKNIFGEKRLNKGEEFFKFFKDISDIYRAIIIEPDSLSVSSHYKNLVSLMRDYIPFDDWIPPLIAYYRKFGINRIDDFLPLLERKTVIEWVVGYTPSKRTASLDKVIKDIEDSASSEKVVDNLKEDLKRKLPMGDIQPYDQSELKLFEIAINGSDFYSEKWSKYLLLRIDLSMVDQESFGGYSGMITIEHILPQNPRPNSEWVREFSEEVRERFTNAIGNLVLLGRRKNSSAGNFDFDTKKSKYFFKNGTTPFRITQEINDYPKWTPEVLKERQKRLVNILIELYFG